MDRYYINKGLFSASETDAPDGCTLVLVTSEELEQKTASADLEHILCHTPSARDARVCKAESRHGCLCGTIVTPKRVKNDLPIAFGYLLTKKHVILCDDTGAIHSMIQHLRRENFQSGCGTGGFFYEFLELLISKDLHHLQELEDEMDQMEDQILSGQMEAFNPKMTTLRKEIAGWIKYYTQLDDLVCEFQGNDDMIFSEKELQLFRMVEKRIGRLNGEAQTLREYGLQLRELFQAEIDIRQNRIMKILTIVTTIFLPLSLIAGWYGMNFIHMPELTWEYGYPAIIFTSVLVVIISLWIMKKKKFW